MATGPISELDFGVQLGRTAPSGVPVSYADPLLASEQALADQWGMGYGSGYGSRATQQTGPAPATTGLIDQDMELLALGFTPSRTSPSAGALGYQADAVESLIGSSGSSLAMATGVSDQERIEQVTSLQRSLQQGYFQDAPGDPVMNAFAEMQWGAADRSNRFGRRI